MNQVQASLEAAKAHSTPAAIQDALETMERSKGQPLECATAALYGKKACWSSDFATRRSAVAALESALQSGHQPSDTAFWLVVAYMEAGQFGDARRTISTLVRQDPSNESAAALLELFKTRVRAEGGQGVLYAAGAAAAVVGLYLLYTWWKGSHAPSPGRYDVASRLERHRWATEPVGGLGSGSGGGGSGRAPPTGSSGSSASAPSAFGNRGSGSWRL